MRTKTLLTFILILNVFFIHGQGKKVVLLKNNGHPSYLAGTLPKSSSAVYGKLKIEIFGGNWHNSNLGENQYFISTRDGVKINQEIHGGSYNRYKLKVYENGNNYDFVIQVTSAWLAFYIRSWTISGYGVNTMKENDIIAYDTVGKVDVTSRFPVNVIFATDNSGNIGIGTTLTGSHKLAVEGSIGAREIKVEANGWSDFVFEPNYELIDLESVEKFVKENKHLPEIPSKREVEANGVDLGKMNSKLLQKIEELTLHLIDVNKRLKYLEENNKQNHKRK